MAVELARDGERTGPDGPCGCGKTTLVGTLARKLGVALRRNGVLGAVRKDPRADGDELRDWLLCAGQRTDLFGGDWLMCVVLDEAVRPDWLVAALDD